MSEFMDYLSTVLEKKDLMDVCFRFGGTKVYIHQNSSALTEQIMSYYNTTSGKQSTRIKETQRLMKADGIYIGIRKIKWTVNNGKKRSN